MTFVFVVGALWVLFESLALSALLMKNVLDHAVSIVSDCAYQVVAPDTLCLLFGNLNESENLQRDQLLDMLGTMVQQPHQLHHQHLCIVEQRLAHEMVVVASLHQHAMSAI